MNESRIAELLSPFLGTTPFRPPSLSLTSQQISQKAGRHDIKQNPCHSQPAPAPQQSFVLPSEQFPRISTYIDILIRWNARVNLTAIRDPEDIVTRHFGESFFAARHLFPRVAPVGTAAIGCPAEPSWAALTVADVGSGAGFPGLPLKLWAPQISLALIESNHKKAAFLREIIRALTLTDVNVITARADTLLTKSWVAETIRAEPSHGQTPAAAPLAVQAFDVVTLRAVERFESILPVAASLVAPGGRLALLIGAGQEQKARNHASLQWAESIPVPRSKARILLIGHRPRNNKIRPREPSL